jgi:dihydroorotate dehydrogenase (NAD+) catalytic subunit
VHETDGGMINSVGLQNPGVQEWLERELPPLLAAGARVVGSIWGFRAEEYAKAASLMAAGPDRIVAIEANLSCPNVEARHNVFAHSATATAEAISAAVESAGGKPVWAKLSPNVTDITEIAAAALDAGAAALTLINTVMGLAVDPATGKARLGAGGGGLSGPAIRPVAVRAIFDCRAAFPQAPIVGAGGVARGEDAAELIAAGADAVQVGTATFLDPRAPARVLDDLARWCRRHDIRRVRDLKGSAHG